MVLVTVCEEDYLWIACCTNGKIIGKMMVLVVGLNAGLPALIMPIFVFDMGGGRERRGNNNNTFRVK